MTKLVAGHHTMGRVVCCEVFPVEQAYAEIFSQVVSKAEASGAAKVIAFVHQSNVQSLRTLGRSGFRKYVVKRERWFLFFRTLTFETLATSPNAVRGQKKVGMLNTPGTVHPGAMRPHSSYMVNSPE